MKRPRLHHLLVTGGVFAGIAVGIVLDTEPRVLGWAFGIGAGLAGGAFAAALLTGEALVGGPGRGRRGRGAAPPAWLDDRDQPSNGAH